MSVYAHANSIPWLYRHWNILRQEEYQLRIKWLYMWHLMETNTIFFVTEENVGMEKNQSSIFSFFFADHHVLWSCESLFYFQPVCGWVLVRGFLVFTNIVQGRNLGYMYNEKRGVYYLGKFSGNVWTKIKQSILLLIANVYTIPIET